MRLCERNNPADTKVSGGGGEGAPNAGAEIPLQPVEKTMVRQSVPLQPMEVHSGADIHLQPVENPTPEQVDMLQQAPAKTSGPVEREAHARAGLLAGLVTPWGTHAGAACS